MLFFIVAFVAFALVAIPGLIALERIEAARRERIARAVRPRHGRPVVIAAPVRNRLGED